MKRKSNEYVNVFHVCLRFKTVVSYIVMVETNLQINIWVIIVILSSNYLIRNNFKNFKEKKVWKIIGRYTSW